MKLMLAAASIAAIVATVTPASAETALDWQTECHSAWAQSQCESHQCCLDGRVHGLHSRGSRMR